MHSRHVRHREAGFSYIDVMIAVVILLVGILTLGAALTAAFVRTTSGENYLRAKAIAMSTLESVMGARYVKVGGDAYSFDAIQNDPAGRFLTGSRDIYEQAGPDGLLGTDDDTGPIIGGFKRQIEITDVQNPDRPSPPNAITERKITVTVFYSEKGFNRTEVLTTNVCDYQQ